MRGTVLKTGLFTAACAAVLLVTMGLGGSSRALPTLIYAGAADPTYLDPGLVSDGESFRVTEAIMEGLIYLKPGTYHSSGPAWRRSGPRRATGRRGHSGFAEA